MDSGWITPQQKLTKLGIKNKNAILNHVKFWEKQKWWNCTYHGGRCCVIRPAGNDGEGNGKSDDEGREGRELQVLSQKGLVSSGGLEDIPAGALGRTDG